MLVPFPKESQLNHQLETRRKEPSNSHHLVRSDDGRCQSLPGQPRMRLSSSRLYNQLEKEFCSPDLDRLAPYLWLVATQSSSHIDPLHEQVLKGRNIIITENPELHLVWTNNRIFIKPIPRYMLSHAFWATHLTCGATDSQCKLPSQSLTKAALGYMRTYHYLIRHQSDYQIAKECRILPFDQDSVTLEDFYDFIAGFGDINDDEVSPRYSTYGTLRLSRLNLWAKIFLRRFQFYQVNRQYSEYFARFYAPILFLFGVLTVVLSAMQVGLQANYTEEEAKNSWSALRSASLWFSVITLLCVCVIGLVIFLLLSFMVLRELAFAGKDLIRRKRDKARAWSVIDRL